MGWWSNHPMGGDQPLDVVTAFLSDYFDEAEKLCPEGENFFRFEEKFYKEKLEHMSVDEIKERMSKKRRCFMSWH